MTAFVIVSLVIIVLALSAALWQTSTKAFQTLNESHERTTKYTEGLIDRLMANDYTTYQDRQLAAQMQYSQGRAPKELEDEAIASTLVTGPDKGGFGSRLGLATPPPDPAAEYEAADQAERDEGWR